jgi:hypothetical protein
MSSIGCSDRTFAYSLASRINGGLALEGDVTGVEAGTDSPAGPPVPVASDSVSVRDDHSAPPFLLRQLASCAGRAEVHDATVQAAALGAGAQLRVGGCQSAEIAHPADEGV